MRGRRAVIVVLLALLVAGCGSGGARTGVTDAQRRALIAELQAVRSSATTGDVGATKAAVGRFRRSVTLLNRSGALSDGTAHELRVGAARLLARVEKDATPPPQPTTTQTAPAPAPPPAPPPPGKDKHKGEKKPKGPKGPGHGHGHGPGGDGEGGD